MPASITPMMQQYVELKEKYSDCLLFFRLGDFYEMFFDDALTASRELEIVLTGRDCGLEERAPMCGVPYHAVDSYVTRLIEKGYKVAICEQLTDPKESKGLVERDVIRVITPGTVIEESMLTEGKNNYIVSLALNSGRLGMAYCDVSTGSFRVMELSSEEWPTQLVDELCRLQPTEIIANDELMNHAVVMKKLQSEYFVQRYGEWAFERDKGYDRLLLHFKVGSLAGFGCEKMGYAISAAGALIAYLEETQKNSLAHIKSIAVTSRSLYMSLDAATRRNLELTQPIRSDASKRCTLLYLLNKTGTAMGARLLRAWLDQPLQNIVEIEERLSAVEELFNAQAVRERVKQAMSSIYDIERLCSRIAYGTVNARDAEALRISLERLPELRQSIDGLTTGAFARIKCNFDNMEDICALLKSAIIESPPLSVKDGGIIRTGYNAEIDELRCASQNGRTWIAKLEADERAKTGIKNLKVGYNRVFGYYIEVTKSYLNLVPYTYQRKQTLANAERYITPELKELEEKILGADEKCITLEYKLFVEIRESLLACIERLQADAALIAETDVYASLAEVAFANGYVRPKMKQNGHIEIIDGRHPVVERSMKEGFVPNSTKLDGGDNRLLIITGPNMAGKSTYMRQVALITLMAHVGSFVPAKSATISITDSIFTRIGASDNLASGQSTFMVEMSEVSNILNNATPQSLLILDEIGRGTSTFDGLSIAWSVLEYIADTKRCGAKTLFATHYHELTELEGKLPGIKNYRISVKEVGDDIIFLRRIVRGGADKSFGVQVARLAGLPDDVIKRAKEILRELESADINHNDIIDSIADANSKPLQMRLVPQSGVMEQGDIVSELAKLDVDALSPREAQGLLYDLHMRAKLR